MTSQLVTLSVGIEGQTPEPLRPTRPAVRVTAVFVAQITRLAVLGRVAVDRPFLAARPLSVPGRSPLPDMRPARRPLHKGLAVVATPSLAVA